MRRRRRRATWRRTGHLTHSVTPWRLSFSPFCVLLLPLSSNNLQRIQNCAARLVLKNTRHTDHITP